MLYDMTGQMATRLRTLLRCFWRRIIAPSRDMRLMADVSSSVGEDVMLWSGCTKHRVPRCRLFKNRQLLVHLDLRLEHTYVHVCNPAARALAPMKCGIQLESWQRILNTILRIGHVIH